MACPRLLSLTLMAIAVAVSAEDNRNPTPPSSGPGSDHPFHTVIVEAERTKEANDRYTPALAQAGTKTDSDPTLLPVSVGVVATPVLRDQGARSVYDGIRNVSSVVQNRGIAFNSASDGAIIRGFRNTAMYWNGFLVEAAGAFNPQTIERLEVLKGPSSMLYGVIEPGGLINVVSRQPSAQQSTTVEQTVGSYHRLVTNVDTTGPIARDGTASYRLVGGGLTSDSFRDGVEEQRYWAAPGFTCRLGERTTVTTEALYSHQQKTLDEGVSFNRNGDAVSDTNTFLGEPGLPGRTQTDLFASARLEHRLTEALTLRSGFLYHAWDVDLDGIRRSATQASAAGQVNRLYDHSRFNDLSYQWTNDVVGRLQAGPTKHEALLGIDARWQQERIELHRAAFTATDINAPVYYQALPATPYSPANDTRRRWMGTYLQDNASLLPDDSLRVLAGGRFDRVISESIDQTTEHIANRDDNAWTGRAGVMWFPVQVVGIYANAAQSFVPANTTSRTVSGDLLDPERGVQYEAGLKLSAFDKCLEGTVAVYQLTKDHVAIGDPVHAGFSVNGGEQRSRGIELDLAADLAWGLDLIASMAWTRSEILESDVLPVGAPLENVPGQSGSLWAVYTIPTGALRDLSFGSGVFAQSEKNGYNALANTPDTFALPGYARIDATIAYRFRLTHGQIINTRLNVLNVFDTTYYESSFASTRVFPGDPRTLALTVGATF